MSEAKEPARATAPVRQPANKRKLGKGLGALLGEAKREEPLAKPEGAPAQANSTSASGAKSATVAINSDGLANIPVSAIAPHPDQPRRHFDEEALEELAASIAARGVIQPVIVRPKGKGYQLVAGERRWRAAQKAQLHEIPALIRDLEERDVMALALIENIQREDLNPVEEARAYQRLADLEGLTQAEIARMVEKSRSHVANFQRLLTLPETVLSHLELGNLTMGHARALVGHDDAEELAKQAVVKKLSVRQMEKLTRKPGKSSEEGDEKAAPSRKATSAEEADIAAVESHLEEFLGLPVKITADKDPRSGMVTIKYKTLDQLDMVCQRLTGGEI